MVPATTEILERLKKLHPKVIDLSLGRINRLLRDLGNPHHRLAPVIHVAGTNGKGSTVAYLRAIFEAARYRVHAYISPHLVHFNERIRIAGQLIEDGLLAQLLMECERINDGKPITFFEIQEHILFAIVCCHSQILYSCILNYCRYCIRSCYDRMVITFT